MQCKTFVFFVNCLLVFHHNTPDMYFRENISLLFTSQVLHKTDLTFHMKQHAHTTHSIIHYTSYTIKMYAQTKHKFSEKNSTMLSHEIYTFF